MNYQNMGKCNVFCVRCVGFLESTPEIPDQVLLAYNITSKKISTTLHGSEPILIFEVVDAVVRAGKEFGSVVYDSKERTEEDVLREGDIVDVDFGVVGIGKGRDTEARMVLRNITLVDARHTQVSEERTGERQGMAESEDKSQLRVTVAGLTLTVRKRPEFDEEEVNARKKMARRRKGTDGAGGEQS
ncbi:hypothetical protein FB446DRAFT_704850 [Lentinula raphanica]|nr:hypothetical protein FB446DRAFT_704850 [Lentinula raphanica]